MNDDLYPSWATSDGYVTVNEFGDLDLLSEDERNKITEYCERILSESKEKVSNEFKDKLSLPRKLNL